MFIQKVVCWGVYTGKQIRKINKKRNGIWQVNKAEKREVRLLWHLDCFSSRDYLISREAQFGRDGIHTVFSQVEFALMFCESVLIYTGLCWCCDIMNNNPCFFLTTRTLMYIPDTIRNVEFSQPVGCFSTWNCVTVWQSRFILQVWHRVRQCLSSGV